MTASLEVAVAPSERARAVLSPDALAFLAELHGRFDPRRRELLAQRAERLSRLRAGGTLDFLTDTREIREGAWSVPPPRADYADRHVEITGPTDRKLVINALNSGAKGFMADFEDASSPTWGNQVQRHVNLRDAIERTISSAIKSLGHHAEAVLPDRSAVSMTVPFMRAHTELLVATCHRRGAFAMGGMAALIPSRKDEEANARAIAAVRADKEREAGAGFDGTWVAHPDVVSVAMDAFDAVLGDAPNQIRRERADVSVDADALLDLAATPGEVTEVGLRANLSVAFQYISFWLGGRGAAGIENLMEDAATAEISRSQIWQWIHHGAKLADGRAVTRELVEEILREEMERIRAEVGEEVWAQGHPEQTREVLEQASLGQELPDFFTLLAYERLD
ncbi:MAG: malate synthase [Solirubrobacteraceae bacterium]